MAYLDKGLEVKHSSAIPPSGEIAEAGQLAGTASGEAPARLRIVSGLVVAFVTAISLVLPSGAAFAAGTAVISGLVRDQASGDPLSGATVNLSGTESQSATTGVDGTYSLTVGAGTYSLSASYEGRTGTFTAYDPVTFEPSSTFTLADGDDYPADIDIASATSTGSISGVVNAGGNGVSGVRVSVYDDNTGSATAVASATSDSDGNYQVSGIPAGRYVVFFDGASTSYGSVWYSEATTRGDATPLFLEGSDLSGINADLVTGFTAAPTPTIAGTAAVGSTLTATVGTWTPTPTLAYQWLRNGAAISGATGLTYALTAADNGTQISFQVTGSLTGYQTTVRTSAVVTVASAFTTAPTPIISGTAAVGSTLTATAGTWAPVPDSLAYQWSAGGTAIAGATASTYVLTAAELGKTITVTVTATKAGYAPTPKTSVATAAVVAGTLNPAPVPTISGTATVGATLTATPGTWGPDPVALTYQWAANGTAITGATSGTYVLTGAELGTTITVTVTGTKEAYTTASKTSVATAAVAAGTLTTVVPTISGTVAVASTLTATPGSWGPAPVTLAYQWKANGTAIAGATNGTYVLTAAELGKTITVTVTGTKAGYTTASTTSAATAAVAAASLTSSVPTITGTAAVGMTLTANPGTWGPTPVTFSYQWLRAGTAITGATGSTYLATSADAGQAISVRVSGTKAGYATVTTTSAAVTVTALADRLASGQQLSGSAVLTSSNSQFVVSVASGLVEKDANGRTIWTGSTATGRLVMQTDGNLVLYSASNAVLFQSRTAGNAGAYAVLNSDGTFVVYTSAGKALYSNNAVNDRLIGSSVGNTRALLKANQRIYSADRKIYLVMQTDGNLVMYTAAGVVKWQSRTAGNAGAYFAVQADGNLVVYSAAGKALWNSATRATVAGARTLVMQTDGNLVLYAPGAIWQSRTRL